MFKKFCFFNAVASLVFSVSAYAEQSGALRQSFAVERYLSSLTERERIAQIFLVNIDGNKSYRPLEYYEETVGAKKETLPLIPGGCLFFSYNIAESPETIIDFTISIAEYCEKKSLPRPYTAIDQEGGVVNRLSGITSPLPFASHVSSCLTPSKSAVLYSLQAEQLRMLGFSMNLAPVSEAKSGFNRDFLGTRSFGAVPSTIAYSLACIDAYQKEGVFCAIKHFPGNSNTDPHTGLPLIDLDSAHVHTQLFLPYLFIFSSSPAALIMSHAVVPSVDSNSAVFSRVWINDILRKQAEYKGLIISDDIFMGAVSADEPNQIAVRAISAGVHVIMLSDKYFASIVDYLLQAAAKDSSLALELHEAERKVIEYKLSAGILRLKKTEQGEEIVSVPVSESLGSKADRLKRFNTAKEQGRDFYVRYFTGEQK